MSLAVFCLFAVFSCFGPLDDMHGFSPCVASTAPAVFGSPSAFRSPGTNPSRVLTARLGSVACVVLRLVSRVSCCSLLCLWASSPPLPPPYVSHRSISGVGNRCQQNRISLFSCLNVPMGCAFHAPMPRNHHRRKYHPPPHPLRLERDAWSMVK